MALNASTTIELFAAVWAVLCLVAGAVVTDTLLRDGTKQASSILG